MTSSGHAGLGNGAGPLAGVSNADLVGEFNRRMRSDNIAGFVARDRIGEKLVCVVNFTLTDGVSEAARGALYVDLDERVVRAALNGEVTVN